MSWKVEGIKTNFTATEIFIWNFLKLGDKLLFPKDLFFLEDTIFYEIV